MTFTQKDSSWYMFQTIYYEGSETKWRELLNNTTKNTKLENLTKNGNVKYNQTWEI